MKPLRTMCYLIVISTLILSGFEQFSELCPPEVETVPVDVEALAGNEYFPVQFPLDEFAVGYFNVRDSSGYYKDLIHAAEDYHMPAGTSVYAISDGVVSFSGKMAGYGWLIIVDHPQVNVYSLYGHLSPGRWKIGKGEVKKGELIAYLGNEDENGSTDEHVVKPHLHFGVRIGQRKDYFSRGDMRWQAGWTSACPETLGWIQPSKFIMEYSEDTFNPISTTLEMTGATNALYALGGLWLTGLFCSMLLGVIMYTRLKTDFGVTGGMINKILPWTNLGTYKQMTTREHGKPGPLYIYFLVCIVLASVAALGFITTMMFLM